MAHPSRGRGPGRVVLVTGPYPRQANEIYGGIGYFNAATPGREHRAATSSCA